MKQVKPVKAWGLVTQRGKLWLTAWSTKEGALREAINGEKAVWVSITPISKKVKEKQNE